MESGVECVHHGNDRYVFDSVIRELHKMGVFSSSQVKLMAMTVCSCRKKVSHRQPINEEEIREAADQVINDHVTLNNLSEVARHFILSSAEIARRLPLTSQGRLALVVRRAATNNDVTLLTEEKSCRTASRREGPSSRKPAKSKKAVEEFIMQRFKKKWPSRAFSLPLFGGSVRRLTDRAAVGRNFAQLYASHRCLVEVDYRATGEAMGRNQALTLAKVWGQSPRAVSEVIGMLTGLASDIQKGHDAVHKLIAARRDQHRWMMAIEEMKLRMLCKSAATSQRSLLPAENPEGHKASLSGDFKKKRRKKKRICRQRPAHRDDGSTYIEGHCLHCLMTLNHFKLRQDDDVGRCRHHPGYVMNSKWTCCNEESETKHPSFADHAQGGCLLSRHHWRPHKKAARDSGQKADRHGQHWTAAPLYVHTLVRV